MRFPYTVFTIALVWCTSTGCASCGTAGNKGNIDFFDETFDHTLPGSDSTIDLIAEGAVVDLRVQEIEHPLRDVTISDSTSSDPRVLAVVGANGDIVTVAGVSPGQANLFVDVGEVDDVLPLTVVEVKTTEVHVYPFGPFGIMVLAYPEQPDTSWPPSADEMVLLPRSPLSFSLAYYDDEHNVLSGYIETSLTVSPEEVLVGYDPESGLFSLTAPDLPGWIDVEAPDFEFSLQVVPEDAAQRLVIADLSDPEYVIEIPPGETSTTALHLVIPVTDNDRVVVPRPEDTSAVEVISGPATVAECDFWGDSEGSADALEDWITQVVGNMPFHCIEYTDAEVEVELLFTWNSLEALVTARVERGTESEPE